MEDPEGRWFSFNISQTDLVILEKGSVPTHLSKLDNLEKAVTLQSLLTDLADQGEVPRKI